MSPETHARLLWDQHGETDGEVYVTLPNGERLYKAPCSSTQQFIDYVASKLKEGGM